MRMDRPPSIGFSSYLFCWAWDFTQSRSHSIAANSALRSSAQRRHDNQSNRGARRAAIRAIRDARRAAISAIRGARRAAIRGARRAAIRGRAAGGTFGDGWFETGQVEVGGVGDALHRNAPHRQLEEWRASVPFADVGLPCWVRARRFRLRNTCAPGSDGPRRASGRLDGFFDARTRWVKDR